MHGQMPDPNAEAPCSNPSLAEPCLRFVSLICLIAYGRGESIHLLNLVGLEALEHANT